MLHLPAYSAATTRANWEQVIMLDTKPILNLPLATINENFTTIHVEKKVKRGRKRKADSAPIAPKKCE